MKRILAVPISFLRCLLYTCILYSFGFAGLNGAPMDGAKLYRFSADHKIIQRLENDHAGVIVDELTRYETAYVWATPLGVASLSSAGHFPEPVIDETDWWNVYPAYQQVNDSLVALAARHPALARIDTIGYSYNRHPLLAITISDQITLPDIGNKPGIMLIGAIHGNEKPGAVLLMNFAEWLLDSVNTDWRLVWLRQDCRFQILPIANPDGYLTNNRMNGHSVDINRSFPDKTTADSNDVTTGREPETQAIMRWTQQTKPMLSIDFHDGSIVTGYPNFGDIDIGANYSFPPQPDRQWYTAAADSYAVYNPPMWNNDLEPFSHGTVNGVHAYQIHGSLADYHYYFHWCRHLTVELANGHNPPAEWLPTMWETNKNSILAVSSLVRQAVSIIARETNLTLQTCADLGWDGPRYLRLGTSVEFRFLLPVGDWKPRIYSPYEFTTFSFTLPHRFHITQNLHNTFFEVLQRTRSRNTLSVSSDPSIRIPAYDSLLVSPYQEFPGRWDSIRVDSDSAYIQDTLPHLPERNWLLKSDDGEGIYVPLRADNMLGGYGGSDFPFLNAIRNFANRDSGGVGSALSITPTGRNGFGLTDSPEGSYANNVNQSFTFNPIAVESALPSHHVLSDRTDPIRISFVYRGDMETWADCWAVSYRWDNEPYVSLDTLTGIVNNWRVWYRDLPTYSRFGTHTIQVKIDVITDNSVVRDGYVMDDLTISGVYGHNVDAPEEIVTIPQRFSLSTAPNPFNAISQIKVTLPREGVSSIVIYDVTGRLVETLQHGRLTTGSHFFLWNAKAYSSGVYFVRASTVNEVRTTKVVLLK